uniref:BEN domain-containing protein n=1 Tax=Ixodes ricinus TaxID=34613 RepID=A0A147BD19_IXORI
MYALARFVNDNDNRFHTVPCSDIQNFKPKNERDFNSKKIYTCFWLDEAEPSNTGSYPIQILLLARTEAELNRQRDTTRVKIPRLNDSDKSEEEDDLGVQRTKDKHELKKKKSHQAVAKKQQFDDILLQHLKHSRKENTAAGTSNVSGKHGAKKISIETSDSDEEVNPTSQAKIQVKMASRDAKHWQKKYELSQQEVRLLRERIAYLEATVDSRLFSLQPVLEEIIRQNRGGSDIQVASFGRADAAGQARQLPGMSQAQTSSSKADAAGQARQHPRQLLEVSPEHTSAAKQVPAVAAMDFEDELQHAEQADLPVPDDQPAQPGDFTESMDGRFHLTRGYYITLDCAGKIDKNKKPTIVIKDAAQGIWGRKVLQQRTLSGAVGPTKRHLGDLARKQLTPEKISVVADTVKYWGEKKKIDVTEALKNINGILSQKIQDARRKDCP